MEDDGIITSFIRNASVVLIICIFTMACACIDTGPSSTSDQQKKAENTPIAHNTTIQNLSLKSEGPGSEEYHQRNIHEPGEPAHLSAEGISLIIQTTQATRSSPDQLIQCNLTITNEGTIPLEKHRLADMYAMDDAGNHYLLSRDVKILGLQPGETRSGTIEIEGIPESVRNNLIFVFRFGEQEARFSIS